MMTHPTLITFTGPSGVGKSTIRRMLAEENPNLFCVLPMVTTRAPKDGDRGEYEYVSLEEFSRLREAGAFVASTRVPGTEERWYAYRFSEMQDACDAGLSPLLVTDQIILDQLKASGIVTLFSVGMLPPGETAEDMIAVLAERLRARMRDTEPEIADRLRNANADIALLQTQSGLFDQVLINDEMQKTVVSLLAAWGNFENR